MKAHEYITKLGIKALLELCNNNIDCAIANIKRVCGEECSCRDTLEKMKAYLKEQYNSPDTALKAEIIKILREEFNYE